ncbi:MAG: hypothetical protein QM696_08610 [Steroidobacteraceae bacterium]
MKPALPAAWARTIPGLLLAGVLCGCSANEQDEVAGKQDTEAAAAQMGCAGFDPELVPATYWSLKPCLEQLHWTVHFSVTDEGRLQTDTAAQTAREDFDLQAEGEQFVWRWEENGSRNGHYSFQGRDNTIDELVIRRQGGAQYSGSLRFADWGSPPGTLVEAAMLSGSAGDTRLSGMDAREDGRLCLYFDLDAQMRGSVTSSVEIDGQTAHPEEPLVLAGMLARDGEVWKLRDELASQVACTGPATDGELEQYDGSAWPELQADEEKGIWSLKNSKSIAIAGLPRTLRYRVELRVNRVVRSAGLPLPAPDQQAATRQ